MKRMTTLIIGLAALIAVMISAPLYIIMTRTQETTLLQGLYDRSSVLLEGIAAGAKLYMPGHNYLELSYLPSQSAIVPEARYVTITGYGAEETALFDYVLATNDENIVGKIDAAELVYGRSRLSDPLTARVAEIAGELNEQAGKELDEISKTIAALNQESLALVSLDFLTPENNRRLDEISATIRLLQNRVTEVLSHLSQEIGSEPAFSTTALKDNTAGAYIFYKPILYRQNYDAIYYRGLVRLEVTIDSIVSQARQGQRAILRSILFVALAAICIGAAGAFVITSLSPAN